MKCRYCGGIYAMTERTCGGCGSPKTTVQTLLDLPAEPGHWSHSMMDTAQRIAVITGIVAVVAILLGSIGFENLAVFVAFFWMIPLAPIGLGIGAWQSSIAKPGERVRNIILAVLMALGIGLAMLIAIGVAVAGSEDDAEISASIASTVQK